MANLEVKIKAPQTQPVVALHEYNYLRRLRFNLFFHSLLLNEELIHLVVFTLHVEHKVEHKLSDGEFHLASVLI